MCSLHAGVKLNLWKAEVETACTTSPCLPSPGNFKKTFLASYLCERWEHNIIFFLPCVVSAPIDVYLYINIL